MKLLLENIKDEEEYYVYSLKFSRTTKKVIRKIIPQKAKFKKKKDWSDGFIRGSFHNMKGKFLGDTWYVHFEIFDNLEEAKEDWNKTVQNTIDQVTSEYEKLVRTIESIKYGNI